MSNFGPLDSTGVVLTTNLPANSTLVSVVPTRGTCTPVQLTVTCSFGSVVSVDDAFATIIYNSTVPGMYTLSGSVAANEMDPDPTNNTPSCTTNLATGSTVNVTASALAGSTFTSWSGACTGTDPNTCAVTMTAAQSVTATFGPLGDFTMALATALRVPTGGQVPDTITLTPQIGAPNIPISFNCSVSPALAQCSFSPPSLTLNVAPFTTTLSIVAIKPAGTASLAPQEPEFALFASLWLPIPGFILAGIGFGSKQPRKKKLFVSLLLVGMLCAGVISQSACGGGSSSNGGGGSAFTPPGQYNVTVTATGGPAPQMATVTLTVQ